MKRVGNLYPQITDFGNLLEASRKAQKGKRFRANVLAFNDKLEQELEKLQNELRAKTYQPGRYKTFEIVEPKRRMISAAPYRDRVVHHALCAVIMPIFERTFISDSYANRQGYGTHRALRKFTQFARSSQYVLQCDIKKFFPSIDHEILKVQIRRKIKCKDTLWLIETIIDSSNPQETVIDYFPKDDLVSPVMRRKGLPIGNLTSQWMGNIMMNPFDHFVKEQLKVSKYLRYVDDFALFSDDPFLLQNALWKIEDYLATLRLKLHPMKTQLCETKQGVNFVGFRVFPDKIRVRSENLKRARRRLKRLQEYYRNGKVSRKDVLNSLQSWEAHLKHGDTYQLRQKIFASLSWQRG